MWTWHNVQNFSTFFPVKIHVIKIMVNFHVITYYIPSHVRNHLCQIFKESIKRAGAVNQTLQDVPYFSNFIAKSCWITLQAFVPDMGRVYTELQVLQHEHEESQIDGPLDMLTARQPPLSLSGTSTHPNMVTLVNIMVMNGWLPSFSLHVNQLPHSSDKAISDSYLETPRSRSWVWSKGKVIQSAQFCIYSLPFHFISIRPTTPEIQLFRNLTLKHPRSKSWVRSKVKVTYSIMMLVKFLTSANQKHRIWSCD